MALNFLAPPVCIEWHNNQKFAQNMPDDEWLEIVGKRGWIVFSHDRKFHTEAVETAAVMQHQVGCFYLPCSQDRIWTKAESFFRSFSRIQELATNTQRPFIYNVNKGGQIREVMVNGKRSSRKAA